MRLYHYTSSEFVATIKEKGILPGDVPVFPGMKPPGGKLGPPGELTKGMGVSLTLDPSFENQAWSQGASVDKDEIRITVEVPDDDDRLIKWDQICEAAIERYGDKKFRLPKDVERNPDGSMKRQADGEPIVKFYSDKTVTLRQWYKIMNTLGRHDAWYIWNGTIPPEWLLSFSTRDEDLIAEDPLTPAAAIAFVESLAGACLTQAEKIAEESTVDGGDTWSGKGIRSMAALIERADLFLWKAQLFKMATTGAEQFDGTAFDVDLTSDGAIFVPDRKMTAQKNDPGDYSLETFEAMLLYPIQKRGSTFTAHHSGQEYSWHHGRPVRPGDALPGRERPDGKYVAGLLFHTKVPKINVDVLHMASDIVEGTLPKEFDGSAPLIVRALPMFHVGEPCRSWGSIMQALFRFMEQKIVTVDSFGPPRAERRRMKRKKMPVWDVKVISLRRYQQAGTRKEEPGNVDWQCQWTVSGHWRRQPTKKGIKVIWIEPFIKGPEDKPLRDPTKSIFSVRR